MRGTGRPSRLPGDPGPAFLVLATLAALAGLAAPSTVEAQARPDTVPVRLAADIAVGQPAASRGGMVVSEDPLATQAGREVLAQGGNAVDAAVAVGFALAVTHPSAGNVGGGGFMVVRFPDGTSTALDFREKAPLAAHPRMFVGPDGTYSRELHHDSHLAVGVPGTVAGFDKAWRLWGTRPWERLLQPAVDLAGSGFELSERLAGSLERLVRSARERGYDATVRAFSKGGVPYAPGEILRQPDLARTLARIRDGGRDGFYRGETAELLAREMERNGGLITREDLARYRARERTPVRGGYRGYEILSMPPPSSGGVALVQMLNVLEGYDLAALDPSGPAYVHLLAEAMRRAYRDRARFLADTDVVDVPVHRLTSEAYAARLRATIDPDRAGVSRPADVEEAAAATAYEGPETTHYSVVDADGTAVSVTYTLEQGYGSKITVPGAGFLLNNEMGDFNARPGLTDERGLIGTEPNLARPEQRMLSSMTPTIVARDGRLVAVVGSPGGRTIINTVLQVVLNLVDRDMTLDQALAAPRLHHQWLPDRIRAEELPAATVEALEAMGHTVVVGGRQGLAHSIRVDPRTLERIGVPDPRNPDATAAGS